MREFFFHPAELSQPMPFHMFDIEYFLWMAFIITTIVLLTMKYKNLNLEQQAHFRIRLSLTILIYEFSRKGLLIILGKFPMTELPLHLCSISVYICLYHAFRPSQKFDDTLFMLVLPGALAALMFPDWNVPYHFNYFYIHSWVIHGLLVLYVSVQLFSGNLVPKIKNLSTVYTGICLYALPIYFLNKVLNTNFLFINTPSLGSPLVFLEEMFGNPGYVFGLAGLCLVIWVLMYLLYDFSAKVLLKLKLVSKYTTE